MTDSLGLVEDLQDAVRNARPTILLADWFIHQAVEFGRLAGLRTFALGQTLYGSISMGTLPRALEAADRILMFSHRSFDSRPPADKRYIYVGSGRPFDHEHPAAWSGGCRRVLVSLSTSYQGQLPVLQALCDALSTLPVQTLVTTGPAIDPKLLRCGSNTLAVISASHDQLLPSADLLVTHGGHGTTLAGVVYGVPMLILPMGRDQPWVAAEAERLGIAKRMNAGDVKAFRNAIADVLNDTAMARRAKAFSASLPPEETLDSAIAVIEGFAAG